MSCRGLIAMPSWLLASTHATGARITIGGVLLVALLNYGQVAADRKEGAG